MSSDEKLGRDVTLPRRQVMSVRKEAVVKPHLCRKDVNFQRTLELQTWRGAAINKLSDAWRDVPTEDDKDGGVS